MGTDRDEYTLESDPRCVQIADPKGYGSGRSSVNDYLSQNWHGSRGGSRIKSDCSSTAYKWVWPIELGVVSSLECNTHANIQSAMSFMPLLN